MTINEMDYSGLRYWLKSYRDLKIKYDTLLLDYGVKAIRYDKVPSGYIEGDPMARNLERIEQLNNQMGEIEEFIINNFQEQAFEIAWKYNVDGMTYEQIATEFGYDTSNVAKIYTKALLSLAKK